MLRVHPIGRAILVSCKLLTCYLVRRGQIGWPGRRKESPWNFLFRHYRWPRSGLYQGRYCGWSPRQRYGIYNQEARGARARRLYYVGAIDRTDPCGTFVNWLVWAEPPGVKRVGGGSGRSHPHLPNYHWQTRGVRFVSDGERRRQPRRGLAHISGRPS